VPAEIVESINIGKGFFAVVGETGSGKTTLLTSMMNYINSACENRKVVTFEAPIEFDMTSLKSSSNMIIQCEIGEHLPSFYDGVKEALRQGPTDILIGEARDKETILAMLQAAESGHAAYVTVHAESVRTTFTRIAQEFDTAVFAQTIFKLITQLRVVVCQRLAVPIKPGRRVPIREWLVLDAALRQRLLRMPAMDALNEIEIEIERQGQSYPQQAMIAYKKGLISATELTKYVGDEAVSLPEVWDGEVPA
jgi:defect-in-organelle-trafficking protein DotB